MSPRLPMTNRRSCLLRCILSFGIIAALSASALAAGTEVALAPSAVGTLHIDITVGDAHREFLLDTGSAYVVLSAQTLSSLERGGHAQRVRSLRAVMANNSHSQATVYKIDSLTIGPGCVARDFEAVVLPGARKNILGLSALRQFAPFTVHFEPSRLEMNCLPPAAHAAGAVTGNDSLVMR
jgi:clan AA aspartic protease (TIGR02281 family)